MATDELCIIHRRYFNLMTFYSKIMASNILVMLFTLAGFDVLLMQQWDNCN